MTAYVCCTECGSDVPWYYAWGFGPQAMHPGCAVTRIDEEGCGATWFPLSITAIGLFPVAQVTAQGEGGDE